MASAAFKSARAPSTVKFVEPFAPAMKVMLLVSARVSAPLVARSVAVTSSVPASRSEMETVFVVRNAKVASSTVTIEPGAATTGASFTAVTVMENDCAALRSTPPLVVPPSSCNCTVTSALPLALAAGV